LTGGCARGRANRSARGGSGARRAVGGRSRAVLRRCRGGAAASGRRSLYRPTSRHTGAPATLFTEMRGGLAVAVHSGRRDGKCRKDRPATRLALNGARRDASATRRCGARDAAAIGKEREKGGRRAKSGPRRDCVEQGCAICPTLYELIAAVGGHIRPHPPGSPLPIRTAKLSWSECG
jgi:hypothetical protein